MTHAGCQLRYLIRSEHGWLGALGFAAAALTLRAREQWIGWNPEQRTAHRPRVVNGIRISGKGSWSLRMSCNRLIYGTIFGFFGILQKHLRFSMGYGNLRLVRLSLVPT